MGHLCCRIVFLMVASLRIKQGLWKLIASVLGVEYTVVDCMKGAIKDYSVLKQSWPQMPSDNGVN